MKKSAILLFFVIAALLACCLVGCDDYGPKGEAPTQTFDLPYVFIETQASKLPTNKTDYVNCSFRITNTEDADDSFAVEMKEAYGDDDSVGIRLRGNSTMKFTKKPYRIKFDKKKSFFGSKKNKSWVLLADYLDPSAMRNYTAFELASMFENLDFTPSHHHVVLYINGEYQGLYLLTDQIDEKEGRTDIEEDFDTDVDTDFPFLVEMGHDLSATGVDNFAIDGFEPMEIKYPEADERDSQGVVFNYIYNYMNAVLTLLKNGNTPLTVPFRSNPVMLADLVDEDSLMDYLLVNEIMGCEDSHWKSIYMHKSKDGKLAFGPVWDFDSCAIPSWDDTPNQTKNDLSVANKLVVVNQSAVAMRWLAIGNNAERLHNRFVEKRSCIVELVDHLGEYKSYVADAAIADAKYWYGKQGEAKFEEQYTFLQNYLVTRYDTLYTLLKP